MNMEEQALYSRIYSPLGICQRVILLNLEVDLFSVLWEHTALLFITAVKVFTPNNNGWVFYIFARISCANSVWQGCSLYPASISKFFPHIALISSTNTHEPTLANWHQFFHYMIDLDNLDKEIFHVTTNLFLCVSELWYHIQHKHLFSYLFFKITQGSKETMNTDSCSATNWEKQILFMMATFNSKLNQTPDTILNI